jgi:hypothetical protein
MYQNTAKQIQCKVATTFRSECHDFLHLRAGERVTLGGRDDQWQGWIWCWTESNVNSGVGSSKGGWVPERILHVDDESAATLLEDYDATELDAAAGEQLTVIAEESGWAWCQNQHGKQGWLPREHLDCDAENNTL